MDCTLLLQVQADARRALAEMGEKGAGAVTAKPVALPSGSDAWFWSAYTAACVDLLARALVPKLTELGMGPHSKCTPLDVFRVHLDTLKLGESVRLLDSIKIIITARESLALLVSQWTACVHTLLSADDGARLGSRPFLHAEFPAVVEKWKKKAKKAGLTTPGKQNSTDELRSLSFASRFGTFMLTPFVEPTTGVSMSIHALMLVLSLSPLAGDLPDAGFIASQRCPLFPVMSTLCDVERLKITHIDAQPDASVGDTMVHVSLVSFIANITTLMESIAMVNERFFGPPPKK